MKSGAVMMGLFLTLAAVSPARAEEQEWPPAAWREPTPSFRIASNIYYVGTKGIAAYLVTDPRGDVLIDTGLAESASLVATNIASLGFDVRKIRYLLISHAHYDHAAGLAEIKRLSGAKLWAGRGDVAILETGHSAGRPELPDFPAVKVDRPVRDGDVLALGAIRLKAVATPGHTPGCMSWEMRTAGRTVLFACSLTVAGQKLAGDPVYPDAAADFRATFAKLKRRKADIFLSFHPESFAMEAKRARLEAGNADAFVDPSELQEQVKAAEAAFAGEAARAEPER